MPKYLHIQVPSACRQQWDDMQPSGTSKFCGNCQKTVVDFTGFTDNQLLEFFRNNHTGICGRFYNDQLEKPLPLPVKKIPWFKYFLSVTFPALLLSYKVQAQKIFNKCNEPAMVINKEKAVVKLQVPFTVSGRVTGLNGEPLAGASIMIAGTNSGTAANGNGYFSLEVGDKQSYLDISHVGYEKKLLPIADFNGHVTLEIPLSEDLSVLSNVTIGSSNFTMGLSMVVVTRHSSTPLKEMDTPEIADRLSIFPNPVQRGGSITVRWDKKLRNKQQLVLYNASGLKLMVKYVELNGGDPLIQLQLTAYPAGYYILQATDCKTREKKLAPFIIQ